MDQRAQQYNHTCRKYLFESFLLKKTSQKIFKLDFHSNLATYEDSVEVDGEKTDQEIMNGAQQELEGALKGEIKEVPLIQSKF